MFVSFRPLWSCSHTQDFPAVCSHLTSSHPSSCSRERGVWLGLSDVNSAGKLLWVNGSEAQEGEEGPAPRSPVARGNLCVSLDQHSRTSSHSCNAKRAYVCQYNPQGRDTRLSHGSIHTQTSMGSTWGIMGKLERKTLKLNTRGQCSLTLIISSSEHLQKSLFSVSVTLGGYRKRKERKRMCETINPSPKQLQL